jgi:hypothetical protein
MGMGVSPWGGAWGGLDRSSASWKAGNVGAGLRRRLAAWAERERGRGYVKRGEGVCAGHWRGSKKGAGRVGGRRGREIRRRARVCTRRSTAGAGKADLTRQAHGAEREKGTRGDNGSALANRARETKRERERTSEGNWRRQVHPTEQRESEGARALGFAPIGETRLSGREGTRARARARAGLNGLPWAELAFSYFPGISNAFSIYFL